MIDPSLQDRATKYAAEKKISLILNKVIGDGTDGAVWKSSRNTAIKALSLQTNYIKERTCYQRLAQAEIKNLCGFSIPQLVGFSDTLQIVEMTIVSAPFVLDFAKCYIDTPPDFDSEKWRDWHEQGSELFETKWPQVRSVLSALKQFGIHYLDAKPGNIMFEDWGQDWDH
jgi:hypothetical protein